MDGALGELESGDMPRMLTTLSLAWAQGDEEKLAAYPRWCQCIKTDADRLQMQRLLDDRNGPMADKIAALHASGKNVLAAVGALHMVGPQGIPELLRARGFAVQRMQPAKPASP